MRTLVLRAQSGGEVMNLVEQSQDGRMENILANVIETFANVLLKLNLLLRFLAEGCRCECLRLKTNRLSYSLTVGNWCVQG